MMMVDSITNPHAGITYNASSGYNSAKQLVDNLRDVATAHPEKAKSIFGQVDGADGKKYETVIGRQLSIDDAEQLLLTSGKYKSQSELHNALTELDKFDGQANGQIDMGEPLNMKMENMKSQYGPGDDNGSPEFSSMDLFGQIREIDGKDARNVDGSFQRLMQFSLRALVGGADTSAPVTPVPATPVPTVPTTAPASAEPGSAVPSAPSEPAPETPSSATPPAPAVPVPATPVPIAPAPVVVDESQDPTDEAPIVTVPPNIMPENDAPPGPVVVNPIPVQPYASNYPQRVFTDTGSAEDTEKLILLLLRQLMAQRSSGQSDAR